MFAARWRNRYAMTALTALVALVVLLSSQHRLRLIVGSFKAVDSMAHIGPNDAMTFMAGPSFASRPGFSKAVSTLAAFDAAHLPFPGDALPTLDDPDTCERWLEDGRRLHCYNADIGACAILAKQNIPARLWDMSGPYELGGDGHNMLEVFDGPANSWKAIDPYYHCYFTNVNDSLALDFPSLRIALLTLPSSIRIVRYSDTAGARPDANIFSELRFLVPVAMLHANNDFRERYTHRYAWLTPVAGKYIDALPLRAARGVRMLMLGSDDRRYIIEDRFSQHYPVTELKWLFWILISIFGISFIGAVITKVSATRLSKIQSKMENASRMQIPDLAPCTNL
jgi:hypothetical protein